jgi:hypothetical protein
MMVEIFGVGEKMTALCPLIFHLEKLPRCFLGKELVQEVFFEVNIKQIQFCAQCKVL